VRAAEAERKVSDIKLTDTSSAVPLNSSVGKPPNKLFPTDN
jgi:hypothetical protein